MERISQIFVQHGFSFFSQDSHDHGLVHVCFGVCVIPLTHDDTFVFEYVVETTCMTYPAAS
jgi:hypothetical protein